MNRVDELIVRAHRLALFAKMVETYPTDIARRVFIRGLHERECLSMQAMDMLLEVYGLERTL